MYQDSATGFLIIFFDSTVFSQRDNLSYLRANFYRYTETLFSHFGNKEYKILILSAYKSYLLGELVAKSLLRVLGSLNQREIAISGSTPYLA